MKYLIYSIDPEGRISGDRLIHAEGDSEAILAVRSMRRPLNTEIWRGDRRVGRIAGSGALPSSKDALPSRRRCVQLAHRRA